MKRVLPILVWLFAASAANAQAPAENVAGGANPSAQAGGAQAGSAQAGSAQAGSAQAGSAQAGSAQAGSAQAGSAQAGSAQVGSAQAGSAQAGSAQAGSAQAGSAQAGSAQAGSAQAGSAQADAGAANAVAPPASSAAVGKAWYDALADKPIDEIGTFWMPKSVNVAADNSDKMFYALIALSTFFFVGIAFAVVYFTIKYRHRPGHKAQPSAAHNDALEITWTIIPTIICVFLFWFGWRSYVHVVTVPTKAIEVNVLAWRWNWQFTHENGVTDSDLHVPAGVPVRLVMTSKDVLHSFYAPALRVKQDLVPRRYTYAWFDATKPGTYRLACAEYCGTSHAQMGCLDVDAKSGQCRRRAVVVVHPNLDSYKRYLSDKMGDQMKLPPVELGKQLYDKKGCAACHSVDGSTRVGPTWKQPDWNKDIALTSGTAKMDENYLRDAILAPQKHLRPGFPNSMPSFEGQLKDKEIEGLIAYIKSLKQ